MSRRLFVCGDIHGCLDALMTKLRIIGFDFERDRLYALGDLVDRGPDSEGVMALLDQPWFDSIQGNHEVLMIEAANGNGSMHVANGGGWFAMLPPARRAELAERAMRLPVAMTVETPSGRKVGLVHADVPGDDWLQFIDRLETEQVRDMAQWSRERIGRARYEIERQHMQPIRNIDHVYMGHTPVKEPVRAANMSWIDTGCFATGIITVEELL